MFIMQFYVPSIVIFLILPILYWQLFESMQGINI